MASSQGTKVTRDEQALQNPKNENPGMVTSDSLAAESIQEGGSFAANADSRGPLNQPSSSTTTNTTDTSNATTLNAAPDAPRRVDAGDLSESAQLNAGRGLGKEAGVGPTYNVSASSASGEQNLQPKGRDLHEGGFDSNAPNASFNTDIGGKNDPGRVALSQMEESNVPVAGGAGPRQLEISGDGQYQALDETSA